MLNSDKISVNEIISFCRANDIKDIVISPGSRNAPFTLCFTSNSFFNCYSIVDERSAGFFGLGIALAKRKPVVLVCTSGSAALNYSPSIVEAYNQNIPLLVITADRPENGIKIGEGQCFNQKDIFKNYSKYNVNLIEQEKDSLNTNSLNIKNVFKQLLSFPFGPVHINVPFNEPLYNTYEGSHETDSFKINNKQSNFNSPISDSFINKWNNFERKIILISQRDQNISIVSTLLEIIKKDSSVYILTENLSNTADENINSCIDRTISSIKNDYLKEFKPDLIITVGFNLISKKIKKLFRDNPPIEHWSVGNWRNQDVFGVLAESINLPADLFFNELLLNVKENKISKFAKKWTELANQNNKRHKEFLAKTKFSDLKCVEIILKNLPTCNLQLANSSVVRYAQLFNAKNNLKYYANRGVSGIDGSSSTAVGFSSVSNGKNVFLTGDVSFFYDSNAFWNPYADDLTIILINNGGGSIFEIIEGPSSHKKSLPFFKTPSQLSVRKFCELYGIEYNHVNNNEQLSIGISTALESKAKLKLIEVDTSMVNNAKILKNYFKHITNNSELNITKIKELLINN